MLLDKENIDGDEFEKIMLAAKAQLSLEGGQRVHRGALQDRVSDALFAAPQTSLGRPWNRGEIAQEGGATPR